MARPMPAPRKKTIEREGPSLGLPDLGQLLASDGVRWADAEFALARAETTQLLRHIAMGIGVAVVTLPVIAAALVIWAQAAVTALTPALRGPGFASLAVGFGLIVCAVLLGLVARQAFGNRDETPPPT